MHKTNPFSGRAHTAPQAVANNRKLPWHPAQLTQTAVNIKCTQSALAYPIDHTDPAGCCSHSVCPVATAHRHEQHQAWPALEAKSPVQRSVGVPTTGQHSPPAQHSTCNLLQVLAYVRRLFTHPQTTTYNCTAPHVCTSALQLGSHIHTSVPQAPQSMPHAPAHWLHQATS